MQVKHLFILFVLIGNLSYGQSRKTKKMLHEIENEWKPDENGKVTYERIVELPELDKKTIYKRVIDFFVHEHEMRESLTQTEDYNAGKVLVKSVYRDIHSNTIGIFAFIMDCWYLINVDVKEGRFRVSLTLNGYDFMIPGEKVVTYEIEDSFPLNPIADDKTIDGKAFYKSHKAAANTLDLIEKSITKGMDVNKKDDW